MKKFVCLTAVFFIAFCALDFGHGILCNFLRTNAKGGATLVNNYIAEQTTDSILVFGSSRAREQYIPEIIGDTLNQTCFNCGYNGMGIIFHYGRWKVISQRYCPRLIIYDVLPVLDLNIRDDNEIFINPLRAYYDVPGVDSIFWKVDPNEKWQMLSRTYQYHSVLLNYFRDYRNPTPLGTGFHTEGNRKITDKLMKFTEKTDYQIDSTKVYFMEKFIQETKGKTTLIFVASPRIGYHDCGNAFDPIIELCKKYNVLFLNHYTDPLFVNNREYFADQTHLNETGATLWSKTIASEIKALLQ